MIAVTGARATVISSGLSTLKNYLPKSLRCVGNESCIGDCVQVDKTSNTNCSKRLVAGVICPGMVDI